MIGTTNSNMLQWLRRALAIVLLTAGCSGDSAMSPAAGLTGVWRGHTPLGSPRDSILLVLVDSTNGVSASAVWRPLDGVGLLDLSGTGSRNGDRLALTLTGPQPFPGLQFDLAANGGSLTGTMTDLSLSRSGPMTLRRSLPASQALVGKWVLTAVRGRAVTPGPGYTDTVTLALDGRARRSVDLTACGFSAGGIHDLRRGWLQLEFLAPFLSEDQCGFHSRDSLEVRGATLTRYTRLRGGVTLEEDYQRR
jgi:hypothetical protein